MMHLLRTIFGSGVIHLLGINKRGSVHEAMRTWKFAEPSQWSPSFLGLQFTGWKYVGTSQQKAVFVQLLSLPPEGDISSAFNLDLDERIRQGVSSLFITSLFFDMTISCLHCGWGYFSTCIRNTLKKIILLESQPWVAEPLTDTLTFPSSTSTCLSLTVTVQQLQNCWLMHTYRKANTNTGRPSYPSRSHCQDRSFSCCHVNTLCRLSFAWALPPIASVSAIWHRHYHCSSL